MNTKKLIESVKTHTVQSGMCDDVTYVEKSDFDRVVDELHNINVLYVFEYNPSCFESCPFAVSLHRTRKGAEMAMEFHKQSVKEEFEELWGKDAVMPLSKTGWDYNQSWDIYEVKIQD